MMEASNIGEEAISEENEGKETLKYDDNNLNQCYFLFNLK